MLQIVHTGIPVNPNKIPDTQKCDVCGKVSWPDENWMYQFASVWSDRPDGYEYYFKTCSDACRKKDDAEGLYDKKKKELND